MLYVVLILILLFAAVVAIRTMLFVPRDQKTTEYSDRNSFDKSGNGTETSSTRNYFDSFNGSYEEFIPALPKLFQYVYKDCIIYRLLNKALIVECRGKSSVSDFNEMPSVFCISYENRKVFGNLLSAFDRLLADSFEPENTLYIVLSERKNPGKEVLSEIESWFKEKNINPGFTLCEGGLTAADVFPEVKGLCYFIGTADLDESRKEKGYFPNPLLDMINILGRQSDLKNRIVYANLWCFGYFLKFRCFTKKLHADLNPCYRDFINTIGTRTNLTSPSKGPAWDMLKSCIAETLAPAQAQPNSENTDTAQVPSSFFVAPCPEKDNGIAKTFVKLGGNVYRFSPDDKPDKIRAFYSRLLGNL